MRLNDAAQLLRRYCNKLRLRKQAACAEASRGFGKAGICDAGRMLDQGFAKAFSLRPHASQRPCLSIDYSVIRLLKFFKITTL